MKHEKLIRKLNIIEMMVEEIREEIDVPQYDIRPSMPESLDQMPDAVREHLFNTLTTEIDHERKVDWPVDNPEPEEPTPDHSTSPRPAVPEPAKPAEVSVKSKSEKGEGKTKVLPTIDWNDDKHLLPRGTRFHSMLLRQQRARYQITQDEFGKECNLGGPTLSMLERGGTRRPALLTIKKISKFTGVSPDLYVIHDARK